jgi:uncharacterized protein YndB with AHSA1/START domain
MTTTRIDVPAGVPFINMEREFDAPRDLVYKAYTDPELLVQWLGPRKYRMAIDKYDVRDGGQWRYIHSDDEGNAWGFHGVFHGTPSIDRVVQTFEFEGAPGHVALDELTLEERDGRTVMRTHSVYQSLEARDAMVESGMAEGVEDGYQRLDELLAGLRQPAAR